jgi:hypothetical protein
MLSARLIQLIETHAESLTQQTLDDMLSNEHTRSYWRFSKTELRPRIFAFYFNLGNWVGNPNEEPVRREYEELGRIGSREGIPLSEIVYTLIIIKKHLRHYIREHGLMTLSGDRFAPSEMVPFELHAIQELNYLVGDFFDRALYHLTRGYEAQVNAKHMVA